MSDGELIEAVRSGDRDAYGVLVERHRAAVYRLCRRMVGNGVEAEDLAHQTFVEAWLKLRQLREPERFGGWVRIIALNMGRMWFRRRRREAEPIAGEVEAPGAPPDAGESLGAQVAPGLAKLPAAHRQVLVLHYLEGLTYKDLAEFLDVPMGTVMSRLHRARGALRGILDDMAEEEGIMATDDGFRREVDAEIGVLLEMSRGDKGKMARMSEILQRAPERVGRLIAEADEAVLDDLACLMPRLGAPALRVALELCASGGAEGERAASLLERSVAQVQARGPEGSSSGAMPPRYGYVLLDELIASRMEKSRKAELVLRLMDTASDESLAVLLTNVLLCWPEEAFPRLMARFTAAQSPEELFRTPDVLFALCRTGARFAEALAGPLASEEPRLVRIGLAGAEGLARSSRPEWLTGASVERYAHEARTRRKWSPLLEDRLPRAAVDALAERVARLVESGHGPIREAALRVLGMLKARGHLGVIRRAAGHVDARTRAAALVALGEMGDAESMEVVLNAAASDDALVRRTAVEVLGRLKAEEAGPLLAALVTDPAPEVRLAVVSALGELGGEAQRELLEGLLRSSDRNLSKAAAKALYRGRAPERKPSDTETLRRERARLGAKPLVDISIDAALRCGLPEIREYGHKELTERFAAVCSDYSATRRYAVEERVLDRRGDVYRFTELGEAVWRVERFVVERYLGGETP